MLTLHTYCSGDLQATFLRGISALAGGKREVSAGAAELEELDDEQLETRCRRNGLSKKGGRDMQALHLYHTLTLHVHTP